MILIGTILGYFGTKANTPNTPKKPLESYKKSMSYRLNTVWQGLIIEAISLSDSSGPSTGIVSVQTAQDTYGTTGRHIFIPRRSKLFGEHVGNSRVIVWKKIVLPDDSSMNIEQIFKPNVLGQKGIKRGTKIEIVVASDINIGIPDALKLPKWEKRFYE